MASRFALRAYKELLEIRDVCLILQDPLEQPKFQYIISHCSNKTHKKNLKHSKSKIQLQDILFFCNWKQYKIIWSDSSFLTCDLDNKVIGGWTYATETKSGKPIHYQYSEQEMLKFQWKQACCNQQESGLIIRLKRPQKEGDSSLAATSKHQRHS